MNVAVLSEKSSIEGNERILDLSSRNLFVGLMSGTSLDGIDAVLVEICGTTEDDFSWKQVAFTSRPYDKEYRSQLYRAIEQGTPELLCQLNTSLGEQFGSAVCELCGSVGVEPSELRAVGSHGQTFWHIPPSDVYRGSTLQLGDPATLAECTGATVISDFRSRDMAVGGQGAPLVSWPDLLMFTSADRYRALQNLGGMANVTWLPRKGSEENLVAFDTGPGVSLINEATRRATNFKEDFDRDGTLASQGSVNEHILSYLMDDPFLKIPPPKSTGRERFGSHLIDRIIERFEPERNGVSWQDLIATLTVFTARTISQAYRSWVIPKGLDEIFLLGGGVHNSSLFKAIKEELQVVSVRHGSELGIDPDAREALAFAVLAWGYLNGLETNIPFATGGSGGRILGSMTPGLVR